MQQSLLVQVEPVEASEQVDPVDSCDQEAGARVKGS